MFSLDRKIGTHIYSNVETLCEDYSAAMDYMVDDQLEYACWEAEKFEPLLEETISLDDEVVRVLILAPDEQDNWYEAEMWMNKDGNLAMYNMNPVYEPSCSQSLSAIRISRISAGPFYPPCCYIQKSICNTIQRILWWLNLNCTGCANNCLNDPSNNPCHSCDPWGLSWILCIWFGHC